MACDPGDVGSGMRCFAKAASWTLGRSAGDRDQTVERSIQRRKGPAPTALPPRGCTQVHCRCRCKARSSCKARIGHTANAKLIQRNTGGKKTIGVMNIIMTLQGWARFRNANTYTHRRTPMIPECFFPTPFSFQKRGCTFPQAWLST